MSFFFNKIHFCPHQCSLEDDQVLSEMHHIFIRKNFVDFWTRTLTCKSLKIKIFSWWQISKKRGSKLPFLMRLLNVWRWKIVWGSAQLNFLKILGGKFEFFWKILGGSFAKYFTKWIISEIRLKASLISFWKLKTNLFDEKIEGSSLKKIRNFCWEGEKSPNKKIAWESCVEREKLLPRAKSKKILSWAICEIYCKG